MGLEAQRAEINAMDDDNDDETGEADLRAAVIAARRQHIKDTARCADCGTDAKTCRVLGAGQPGPEGLCCWTGRHTHRRDQRALDTLMDEIAAGGPVRTVAEVDPPPVLGPRRVPMAWLLAQDTWWYPQGRAAVRIDAMDKPWRYNTVRYLERRAPQYASQEYNSMAGLAGTPWGPSGDMACDAFDREMDDLLREPLRWLHARPLLRALRRHLPDLDGPKGRKLAARAVHWNTCPMRLAHPGKLDRCLCIREGGRTVGATNDPASLAAVTP